MNKYLLYAQMPVVSSQYWNMVHGNTPDEVRQAQEQRRQDYSRYSTGRAGVGAASAAKRDTREQQVTQPIHVEKTVGRNDPCPCGSGKKYKNCHGKNA